MTPFVELTGIAAGLAVANIDTDMLLPARFLKTVSRAGLGTALFHTQRFDDAGEERPEFVLNRLPWRAARILIAHDNFGCGSSREHAPWALLDFGIQAIIAPSFADIFAGNCAKNGILAVTLPRAKVDQLMIDASLPKTACMSVDLRSRIIRRSSGETMGFEFDAQRRARLLDGIDDIAATLALEARITAHEAWRAKEKPWIRAIPSEFLQS